MRGFWADRQQWFHPAASIEPRVLSIPVLLLRLNSGGRKCLTVPVSTPRCSRPHIRHFYPVESAGFEDTVA